MSDHDLHDQLERLGRQPVPPPRPEFVESLLARIQLTDDLREPAPVIYLRRQSWAKARLAVAGAAAAVLLGAVGMVALARGGEDSGQQVSVSLASGQASEQEIDDGRGDYPDVDNGDREATCTEGGKLEYVGGEITCATGEKILLTFKDGHIVDATSLPEVIGEEGPGEQGTTTVVPELPLESTKRGEGGVDLSWVAPDLDGVASFVVERAVAAEGQDPPPIDTPSAAPSQVLGSTASTTTDSLVDLVPTDAKVAYRVFALSADGTVLAQSKTVIWGLRW